MSPLSSSVQITAAHSQASASLLRLLLEERQLLTMLRSIKHYFLLDQVGARESVCMGVCACVCVCVCEDWVETG